MKVSFEGVKGDLVTFLNQNAAVNTPVKVGAAGTVKKCSEGDEFDGYAVHLDNGMAAVRLHGLVTAYYSGDTAPGFGTVRLVADGDGGVMLAESGGRRCTVVDKDATEETVTFFM